MMPSFLFAAVVTSQCWAALGLLWRPRGVSSSLSAPPSESTNQSRIYFFFTNPTRHFFREQKIRLEKRKHELHYLLPPRSSSPLHRSGLEPPPPPSDSAVADNPNLLDNPSHARSVAVEVPAPLSIGKATSKI